MSYLHTGGFDKPALVPEQVEFNQNHYLARGMVFAQVGGRDWISGVAAQKVGSGTARIEMGSYRGHPVQILNVVSGAAGFHFPVPASYINRWVAYPAASTAAGGATWVVITSLSATTASGVMMSVPYNNGNWTYPSGSFIGMDTTATTLVTNWNFGYTAVYGTQTSQVTADSPVWHMYGAQHYYGAADNQNTYIKDGSIFGTYTSAAGPVTPYSSGGNGVTIGARNGTESTIAQSAYGKYVAAFMWNRKLSQGEIQAIFRDFTVIFKPRNPAVLVPPATVAPLSVSVSDTVTTSEGVGVFIPTGNPSLNVSDSITVSESVNLNIPTLFIGVSDTVTTSESIGMYANVTLLPSTSDTVTTSESVSVTLPNVVQVIGLSEGGNSSGATNWTVTTPSQLDTGTTTLIMSSAYSANTLSTPATDWAANIEGFASLDAIWGAITYQRDSKTFISDRDVTNDNPSTSLTFTQTSNPSVSRHTAAVTISGGVITGSARIWKNGHAANTNGVATGNGWRYGGCRPGDKLIFMIASYRGDQDVSIITTGSDITMTNIKKEAYYPGTTSATPGISIWSADCNTTQATATVPNIGIYNPAGNTNAEIIYMYAFRPTPRKDLGSNGNPVRTWVIGDSLTQGAAFAGPLGGNTVSSSPQRWIDRLFGSQATSMNTTLNFQSDANIIGTDVAPRQWYTGTYTPYDGSPTTSVKIRNMGQAGWDTQQHYVNALQSNNIRNELDSSKGPDILIMSLGANDERYLVTISDFKRYMFGLVMASGAKYIVFVKQWAWAFDYANDTGAFTRLDTHANYLAAIDTVATWANNAGLTAIVVSLASSATTSGGTNVATVTATESYSAAVGTGGAVDNIHGNSASHQNTWAPAIQTGLDQIILLNPPNVTDTVTTSESVTVSIAAGASPLSVNVSDTVTTSESVSLVESTRLAVSDTVTTSESVTVTIQPTTTYAINVSDTVTSSESVAVYLNTNLAVSDTVTTSESVNLLITVLYSNVSDTVTTSESALANIATNLSVTDTVTTSESLTALITKLFITVSDTVTTTESANINVVSAGSTLVNVSDTVTASESVNLVESTQLSVSDTVTTSESATASPVTNVSVSDTTTTSESVTVTPATIGALSIAVSDTVTTSESVAGSFLTQINVSDSTTVSEAVTVTVNAVGSSQVNVSDTVTTSESTNVFVPKLLVNVNDTVTTTESVTIQKVGAGTVTYPSVKGIELGGGLVKVLKSGVSQIAFVNGAPTDTPVGYLMAFDYANNKLYIYNVNTASWKSVTLT